MLRTNLALVE